jgi:polysaccharide biosynthesis/export protein
MRTPIRKKMQPSLKILFVLALASVLASTGAAQQNESLLIGPGDQVQISVFDTPEMAQVARVTDTGTIPLSLGGDVKIAGETPAEAAHAIEKALVDGRFMLHPRVTVTVTQFATQNVSVLGEVKAPGAYPIGTPRSVIHVLALAGGLNESAARKITIERAGSHEKVPYFVANQGDAALDTAVTVNPGDTIFVPRAGIVYVLGDVGRPGGYTMTNNDAGITALELVARAGGTNHSAVPANARLIHKIAGTYTETPLPLSLMQKGKSADIALEADDIIYVPFSYLRNFGLQASGLVASLSSAAIYQF